MTDLSDELLRHCPVMTPPGPPPRVLCVCRGRVKSQRPVAEARSGCDGGWGLERRACFMPWRYARGGGRWTGRTISTIVTGATCCLGSRSLNVGAGLRSEAKRKVPTWDGYVSKLARPGYCAMGVPWACHRQTVLSDLSYCLTVLLARKRAAGVGDAVPTAPCCSHLIFLLLHASSRQDPLNHMARQTRVQHRVIAAISASHHQFLPLTRRARLPRPAQPRASPTPSAPTLSTLIYTTPHYASATETNSKLGKARCNHAALHAHLGSEAPAGDPCPPRPGRLSLVQPAVRSVGLASLPWPICFSGLPLRDICTVLRPPTSFLCPASPRPRRGRPVCAATGHPKGTSNHRLRTPEQHDG